MILIRWRPPQIRSRLQIKSANEIHLYFQTHYQGSTDQSRPGLGPKIWNVLDQDQQKIWKTRTNSDRAVRGSLSIIVYSDDLVIMPSCYMTYHLTMRDLLAHRVCLTDDDVTLTLGDPEEIDFGRFFSQRVRYLSYRCNFRE